MGKTAKFVDFAETEEYYQLFRILINQLPSDQQEQCLDFIKGLCRLTKKQIKVFSDFADRYRNEGFDASIFNPIYSVLLRLASEDGISIKREYIKHKSPEGERYVSYVNAKTRRITLDLSMPLVSEKDNNDLILHLASQMGALQMLDAKKQCRNANDIFHQQSRNVGAMLINGIDLALWARQSNEKKA